MKRIKRFLINVYQYLGIDKLCIILKLDEHFYKEMEIWMNKKDILDTVRKKELEKDIRNCYINYLTTPAEFFLLGFDENKSTNFRESFLSDKKRTRILKKIGGGLNLFDKLSDKWSFYTKTKQYFNRKVIKVTSSTEPKLWGDFCKDLDFCFVKPLNGTWGKGCSLYSIDSYDNRKKTFNCITKTNQEFIVEEKIIQCEEMAKWNESSCNTIRLPVVFYDNKIKVIQPFLRVGRKGMIVDNAGSGGLFAVIDEKTGIIKTDAIDKDGNIYSKHPDSDIVFKGNKIPKWEELIAIAEDIFKQCLSEHTYVGFDFALTDKGWCLIEGNWGQFVGQYIERRGVKKEFLNFIK